MPGTIAKIRHRLSLESLQLTPDGVGGFTRSWQQFVVLWGALKPINTHKMSSEVISADKITSSITHEITLRYRDDVTPDMRFVSGTRVFNILSVYDKDGRKTWLTCLCEETR